MSSGANGKGSRHRVGSYKAYQEGVERIFGKKKKKKKKEEKND